jgi:hypothetical protein
MIKSVEDFYHVKSKTKGILLLLTVQLLLKAAKEFFVGSAYELLMVKHMRLIEIEMKIFNNLELFKELIKTIEIKK